MTIIGFILAAIGALGLLLDFTSTMDNIPAIANLGIPTAGWAGALIVGAVLLFLNRRATD